MKSGDMKSGEESGFDGGKAFDGSLQIMRESADRHHKIGRTPNSSSFNFHNNRNSIMDKEGRSHSPNGRRYSVKKGTI